MTYHCSIYAIRHNITNRVYVGSSSKVAQRVKQHLINLRAHMHKVEDMQEDFDKYGEDYTISVLEEIYECADRKKEYEWMEKLRSNVRGIGYNYKDRYFIREVKHYVEFNGKTMSLGEWAENTGIPYNVLYNRIISLKWDTKKAFTTPYVYRRQLWNKTSLNLSI